MSRFTKILASVALLAFAGICRSEDLQNAAFDCTYVDPQMVTGIVNDIIVDLPIDEEHLHDVVEGIVEDAIGGSSIADSVVNIVQDAGYVTVEQVVSLINEGGIEFPGFLDTNAVEDISAYTISNVVNSVALTGDYNDLSNKPVYEVQAIEQAINDAISSNRTVFEEYIDATHSNYVRAVEFAANVESDLAARYKDLADSVDQKREEISTTFKTELGSALSNYVAGAVVSSFRESSSGFWFATNAAVQPVYDNYVLKLKIFPSIAPSDLGAGNYVYTNYIQHGELIVEIYCSKASLEQLFNPSVTNNASSASEDRFILPVNFRTLEIVHDAGTAITNTLVGLKSSYLVCRSIIFPKPTSTPDWNYMYFPVKTGVVQDLGIAVNGNSTYDIGQWWGQQVSGIVNNNPRVGSAGTYAGRRLMILSDSIVSTNKLQIASNSFSNPQSRTASQGEYLYICAVSPSAIGPATTRAADAYAGMSSAYVNYKIGVSPRAQADHFMYFTSYGFRYSSSGTDGYAASSNYTEPSTPTANVTPTLAVCLQASPDHLIDESRVMIEGYGSPCRYLIPTEEFSGYVKLSEIGAIIEEYLHSRGED